MTFMLAVALSAGMAFGAKTRKVTAEYVYHIPDNVSADEARSIALQRAQAQAIADEFGTLVTQSSQISLENSDAGTHTDFLSIGGSELKGEWIETIGEPDFKYVTDGESMVLTVKVKGVIREIDGVSVPFDVKILRNATTDDAEADRFQTGDDMYLSFNAPASGYVAVYLIDTDNNAFCLLPYQGQEDGLFRTKANKRYLFFHPDHADGVDRNIVDEFVLNTDKGRERNRILTIFSPNRFFKASDTKTQSDLPRSLGYADFQKWLAGVKKRDADLTVTERSIVISDKK